MNRAGTVLELARADFLERARRYGFLVTLGAAAYLAYTVHAGWWTVRLGRYFAEPGPAWTGTLVAVATGIPLALLGFYVVRGTVDRDRRTRVGPILAATPTTRLQYAAAKFTSNLMVLGSMLLLLMGLAVIIAAHRAGGISAAEAWQVVAPSLLVTAPMLVTIAGLAVLFDSLPGLGGVVGNVLFFFLWVGTLTFAGFDNPASVWVDFAGIGLVREVMETALSAAHPGAAVTGLTVQISNIAVEEAGRFAWPGIAWNLEHVIQRFYWFGVGGLLTGLSALSLRLFDPFADRDASGTPAKTAEGFDETASEALVRRAGAVEGKSRTPAASLRSAGAPAHSQLASQLSPAANAGPLVSFLRTLRGELRLQLYGHAWWWYAALATTNVVALLVPAGGVSIALLVAWLLPLSAWSSLGCREHLHGTEELLFSAPSPRLRQLPAQWAAGVALAVLAAAGPLLRLVAAGDLTTLTAAGAGALFIPALALGLGTWSGKPRTFEAIYLILWYLGPANGIPQLDFMGATGGRALAAGATPAFTLATAALIAMAWLGRSYQLRTG